MIEYSQIRKKEQKMIYFCLSGYDWSQKEKDEMTESLKKLDFAIDDLGSVIFVKYTGGKLSAIISCDVFTSELRLLIFAIGEPEKILLTIPQKRISAVYRL